MNPLIDRRLILSGLAGGALAPLAAGPAAAASPAPPGTPDGPRGFTPGDWHSVRDQFRLSRGYAQFAAFTFAAHPAGVREAIATHRSRLDEDPSRYHRENADRELAVRTAAADYLGVRPLEVALTDSTTMGLAVLYQGLRLRPGDEILTTRHDFHSTYEALRQRALLTGAAVRRVSLYEDPAAVSADQLTTRLLAAVTPRTRVLALTWVHSGTGVMLPIRMITDAVAAINARRDAADRLIVCVDGVHGLGATDTVVADLGCDFFAAGTHKWLYGPRGTGILWGREDAWPLVQPIIPSFGWIREEPPPVVDPGLMATPGGFHTFEHRWALPEAFAFHTAIGRERIARRIRSQARQLKDGLAAIPGVHVATPRDDALSCGIVCFSVTDRTPRQVVTRLESEHRVLADVTPYGGALVRLGPSLVTDPQEVDRAVHAVATISRT
ncbi:aminotransferase class V-fold PLP-dependent enzyme [Kitasatospora sp. NPDC091207]|uniref:aminotransferase class V-fold PLP-dependent enzyme n=1 Tax=Kitasatospora sp. NPDC091207 TaxID=3364083 RepID=UPI00380DDBF8